MAERISQNYGKALKHAVNQMNRRMDAYAKHFGLTGVQMSIIDFVGNQAQVLQRDIEQEFNIRRSTATVALQRMEQQGLIVRQPAMDDGRQKQVKLTAKAQALHQQITAYIEAQQQAMTTAFTPEEQTVFMRMLAYFTSLNTPEQ